MASSVELLVVGDVNVDVVVVPTPPLHGPVPRASLCRRDGGAVLVASMLFEAIRRKQELPNYFGGSVSFLGAKLGTSEPIKPQSVREKPYLESIDGPAPPRVFADVALELSRPADPGSKRVYRVARIHGPVAHESGVSDGGNLVEHLWDRPDLAKSRREWTKSKRRKLLVVYDRDEGQFRSTFAAHRTEFEKLCEAADHVLVQFSGSLDQHANELTRFFLEERDFSDKLTAFVPVDCLRRTNLSIRYDGSLEMLGQDLYTCFAENELLKQVMSQSAYVVCFPEGSIYGDRTEEHYDLFCPQEPLGVGPKMSGYNVIRLACGALGVGDAMSRGDGALEGADRGARLGTLLCARHFRNGYAPEDYRWKDNIGPTPFEDLVIDARRNIGDNDVFDPRRLDGHDGFDLARTRIPNTGLDGWSRVQVLAKKDFSKLGDVCDDRSNPKKLDFALKAIVAKGVRRVCETVEEIADRFPRIAYDCPFLKMGKIKSLDRDEVDRFLSMKTIIRKYIDSPKWSTPLSLAVFGPPGSGKSFAVKQIIGEVSPGTGQHVMEYNLAQFSDEDELKTAFHQVQDRALGQDVPPLVVFDEFDTDFGGQFGWLKYFLAPMQDGEYKSGESTYKIGRAIFLFAGGTKRTFREFYVDTRNADETAFKRFKIPDFVSRLRGHLDIIGVEGGKKVVDELRVMFRRALLIRGLLQQPPHHFFDKQTDTARVEDSVLWALLKVKEFAHGVRSIQAIIEMSSPSPSGSLGRSNLPASEQLGMHVDVDEFLELIDHGWGVLGDAGWGVTAKGPGLDEGTHA